MKTSRRHFSAAVLSLCPGWTLAQTPACAGTFDAHHQYTRESAFTIRPFDVMLNGVWIGNAISYGPFRDGQEPDTDHGPTAEQILQDMRILQRRWNLIRMYGSDPDTRRVLEVIRQHKIAMKVMLGAWIEPADTPAHLAGNERQVDTAIELANAFPEIVRAVNVGNETQVWWTGHKVKPEQLVQYIRAVRGAVRQPVTTADDYNFWNKPESRAMAAEVDFIVTHLYAQWNGQQLRDVVSWTEQNYNAIRKLHPDRVLMIGESGWATRYNAGANGPGQQGSLIKGVVSDAAQAEYLRAMNEWVQRTRTVLFHFEAFDENWKGGGAQSGPAEVEKHWGLFDAQRRPKPAVQAWFPELPPAAPSNPER